MTNETTVHLDRLGREILLDDCVAYPQSNSLQIGIVVKLNKKMVGVRPAASKYRAHSNTNKYPSDLVKLDGPEVTLYLLKHQAQ